MQGTNTMNAITIGNKTVQQKDISWSNLIRGKEALACLNILLPYRGREDISYLGIS